MTLLLISTVLRSSTIVRLHHSYFSWLSSCWRKIGTRPISSPLRSINQPSTLQCHRFWGKSKLKAINTNWVSPWGTGFELFSLRQAILRVIMLKGESCGCHKVSGCLNVERVVQYITKRLNQLTDQATTSMWHIPDTKSLCPRRKST